MKSKYAFINVAAVTMKPRRDLAWLLSAWLYYLLALKPFRIARPWEGRTPNQPTPFGREKRKNTEKLQTTTRLRGYCSVTMVDINKEVEN